MDEIEEKINSINQLKTKYIIIKRMRIKSDIKIKCQIMKLKNKINSINYSRSNILQ